MPLPSVRDAVAPPASTGEAGAAENAQRTTRFGTLPLYVALLALAGYLLRFGYVYGAGGHDALIPSLLHLLDPDLFRQDWLVQTVTEGINVHTYFLWLIALPSLITPPAVAVALLWAGTLLALGFGVWGLARELVRDRVAAALSVPVALVVTVKWALGANSLAYGALVPEGVAWALAVPAVTLFLQRRWLGAGALLGIAAWFHLLAGAQAALVLGGVGLVRAGLSADLEGRKLRADVADLVRFGGAFLLTALPILVPVVLGQFAPEPPVDAAPSPFYIHTQFRSPSSHLFFSFDAGQHLRFWPLVVLGVACGVWLHRRDRLRHGRFLAGSGVVIALLCALAVVFVEVVPVSVVAKLHFFKLTVLVVLAASILACGTVAALLPVPLQRFGAWLLDRRWTGLAVVLVLLGLVVGLGFRSEGRLGAPLFPVHHAQTLLGEVETWVRAETAEDALWTIPPSVSTFRSYARRAVVANYPGAPVTDRDLQRWFLRLMDVTPHRAPAPSDDIDAALNAAYHDQNAAEWRQLRRSYGVEYALVERDAAALPFEVAFENEDWSVYRLGGEAAP